jgi:hypothetical protein
MMDVNWWAMAFAGLAAAFTLVAIVLAYIQADIMRRQTALMEKQTEIIEKQDWLLSRRPTFNLKTTVFDRNANEYGVEMRLWNVGNKGVRDFYWHIFIPQHAEIQVFVGQERAAVNGVGDTEGVRCEEYSGHVQNPLYPTQSRRICELRMAREILQTSQIVFWNVVCEEGKFPEGGGRCEIRAPT